MMITWQLSHSISQRVLNAFTAKMVEEFAGLWQEIRLNDEVHSVVLRAAGDRSFSIGRDFKTPSQRQLIKNVWAQVDPGRSLGPKQNHVWKPVVCAVNGMCAGAAFYWINEVDIIVCSEDATFFDAHVSLGQVAAMEPLGLLRRAPLEEVLRLTLLGLDERMSAQRAYQVGLVSEVVPERTCGIVRTHWRLGLPPSHQPPFKGP